MGIPPMLVKCAPVSVASVSEMPTEPRYFVGPARETVKVLVKLKVAGTAPPLLSSNTTYPPLGSGLNCWVRPTWPLEEVTCHDPPPGSVELDCQVGVCVEVKSTLLPLSVADVGALRTAFTSSGMIMAADATVASS